MSNYSPQIELVLADEMPQYKVIEHPRAKNVSLKLSLQRGLEVVVPRGYDTRKIPAFIAEHRAWLEKTQRRMSEERQALPADYFTLKPRRLELQAIGETLLLDYQPGQRKHIKCTDKVSADTLLLSGPITNEIKCARALQVWLRDKARSSLVPWLRRKSCELQLPYEKTIIRRQKTCWGSCSAKRVISLNCKLLFLPPAQVEYLMVHELCHTRHFNHGKRFWGLVEKKLPGYSQHENAMKEAWQYVPHWADV